MLCSNVVHEDLVVYNFELKRICNVVFGSGDEKQAAAVLEEVSFCRQHDHLDINSGSGSTNDFHWKVVCCCARACQF